MARVECYLSDKAKDKLTELANENGCSVSKYIGQIVENQLNHGTETERFQRKTNYILAQILGSVYDQNISTSNTETVKSLLKKIDEKVKLDLSENTIG